jgi:hypothetical protein
MSDEHPRRWSCSGVSRDAALIFRQTATGLLALVLAMCVAAPALDATEGEDRKPADTGATEAAESEKDPQEEKGKKEKKEKSFAPVPIIITEPAIGYGLGAAVGYFHKKKDQDDSESGSLDPVLTADTAPKAGKQQKVPPTISGIAAAYTEKGTWFVGFGHSASWRKDRIRYTGAIAYAHVVSTFYFNDQPADFKLDTGLLYQDIKFRIKSSKFFVGGKLVYINPKLLFDEDLDQLPIDEDELQLDDFGLALQADYDGRDNKMTPNRGQFVELVAWEHLEALGGETAYWKVGLVADSYHELAREKLVLGLHLDFDTAGGDPPLWGYPWITMRGIPALRYQNESTAVFATELRWNLASRWAAVGFLGVGATRGDVPVFEDESGIVAGGVGGRYLFRPQDSLWVGLDVAKGPEQYVLYVVAGHKW